MSRIQREKRGFTLVELLVVIAIIGILAGFIVGGVSRAREKAKIADANNTMRQIETMIVEYYTTHNTYPPAYGFLSKEAFKLSKDARRGDEDLPGKAYVLDIEDTVNNDGYFVTESYLYQLGLQNNLEYYDPFALDSTDTDYDGTIGRLEYNPTDGINDFVSDYSTTPESIQRPFIYIPINQRQFRRVKEIWDDPAQGNGFPDFDNPKLRDLEFPPASYDSFIIASAGVVANTQGLIYDVGTGNGKLDETFYEPNYAYHIAAMATYYILTRDFDNDLIPDFDFDGRASGDQEAHVFPNRQHNSTIGPGVLGPIYRVMK